MDLVGDTRVGADHRRHRDNRWRNTLVGKLTMTYPRPWSVRIDQATIWLCRLTALAKGKLRCPKCKQRPCECITGGERFYFGEIDPPQGRGHGEQLTGRDK